MFLWEKFGRTDENSIFIGRSLKNNQFGKFGCFGLLAGWLLTFYFEAGGRPLTGVLGGSAPLICRPKAGPPVSFSSN